jgi:hypothetical protein
MHQPKKGNYIAAKEGELCISPHKEKYASAKQGELCISPKKGNLTCSKQRRVVPRVLSSMGARRKVGLLSVLSYNYLQNARLIMTIVTLKTPYEP